VTTKDAKVEITAEQWADMKEALIASTRRIPARVMNGSIQEAQRWKEAARRAYSLAHAKRPTWVACSKALDDMRSFSA
jgi:hypothetical protein